MSLQSKRELDVTRKKLQDLEQLYAATLADCSNRGLQPRFDAPVIAAIGQPT